MIGKLPPRLIFEVSLYLLLALPVLLIVMGGGISWIFGVFFFIAMIVSWHVHRRGLIKPEHARWFNGIIVAFVIFSVAHFFLTDISILNVGVRVVLVLALIKLLSRNSTRDEHQLYVLSFALLAAATAVNEDLAFGVVFSLYVVIGTVSLAVFHLRNEMDAHPRVAFRHPNPLNRSYVFVLVAMSTAILALSALVFFAFPRVGLGFFVQQSRDGVSMVGFSESVELGGHGVVRDNPQVVLRVEFPEDPPERLSSVRWRMMAFDRYDGRGWDRTLERDENRLFRRNESYTLSHLYPSTEVETEPWEIYMEPLNTNILPTPWPTTGIRLGTDGFSIPFGPRRGFVTFDLYGDLRHTIESQMGVAYRVWPGEPPSESSPTPDREPDEAYLQTPEFSTEFKDLVDTITGDLATEEAKAEAIDRWLGANLTYTTNLPVVGANPVESFVFETRQGHCEYFATTAVMMLRLSGVPTRLVNGFLGGQWNDVGDYWTVRQGDAHSWVEYWNPRYGWVMLDPTPPSEGPAASQALRALRSYVDAARMTWMKWVIEYDLSAQVNLFRDLKDSFSPDGISNAGSGYDGPARGDGNVPWRPIAVGFLTLIGGVVSFRSGALSHRTSKATAVVAGSVSAVAAGLVVTELGSTQSLTWSLTLVPVLAFGIGKAWAAQRSTTQARAQRCFDRIQNAARRHKIERPVDQGVSGFLARLTPHVGHEQLNAFEALYLRVRFDPNSFSESDVDQLEALSQHIVTELKKNRSTSTTKGS